VPEGSGVGADAVGSAAPGVGWCCADTTKGTLGTDGCHDKESDDDVPALVDALLLPWW
jgi:hypothetical protein